MTSFNVDRNHTGVRLGVLAGFFVGFFVGGFVLTPTLIRVFSLQFETNFLIGLVLALLGAPAAAWLSEKILHQVWPSGRRLTLSEDSVTLEQPNDEDIQLTIDNRLDVFTWSFAVDNRRAWVPRGWYCLAMRIMRGKAHITPYTFVKPEVAANLERYDFPELISKTFAERPGNEHLMGLYHDQAHLRAMEDDRWLEGAELQPDEFLSLLREVDKRLPNWPA